MKIKYTCIYPKGDCLLDVCVCLVPEGSAKPVCLYPDLNTPAIAQLHSSPFDNGQLVHEEIAI